MLQLASVTEEVSASLIPRPPPSGVKPRGEDRRQPERACVGPGFLRRRAAVPRVVHCRGAGARHGVLHHQQGGFDDPDL